MRGQSHACAHVTTENSGGGTSGFMMRVHFRMLQCGMKANKLSLRILFRSSRLLNLDCAICPSKFDIPLRTTCWHSLDLLKHWKETAGYKNRMLLLCV